MMISAAKQALKSKGQILFCRPWGNFPFRFSDFFRIIAA
jgi:hypothetical protein